MKRIFTFFIVAVVVCNKPLRAQLIFNETFNYSPGDLLEGRTGGTGFSTGWSNASTGNTGANALAEIVTGQINASSVNKLRVTLPASATTTVRYDRTIAAALNNDASTTEYWLGYWLRIPATSLSTSTYGVAAQVILMNGANSTVATDMRLGFGKTSNYASMANSANALSMFTRAAPNGCVALNFPSTWNGASAAQQTLIGLSTVTDNVVYVLANIKKLQFANYQQPSTTMPNPNPMANFDGFRFWFLSAPPTGPSDPIFTDYPNGHISTIEPVTMNPLPILNRMLRADNTVNTTCVKDGVTGLRIRVEGNPGTTTFVVEFDDVKLATSLSSLLVVPITFKHINAFQKGNINIINWATSSENNNKGFTIERSTNNGVSWSSIGFVPGALNSNSDEQYEFIDNSPVDVTLYRIQQTDIGGKSSYSKVVKVNRNSNSDFSLAPNPAQNNVIVKLNKFSNNNTVFVYNSLGKTMLQENFNSNTHHIDVSNLSKGVYYVRISGIDGVSTQKFIKN
jgi:hypothetical protein